MHIPALYAVVAQGITVDPRLRNLSSIQQQASEADAAAFQTEVGRAATMVQPIIALSARQPIKAKLAGHCGQYLDIQV